MMKIQQTNNYNNGQTPNFGRYKIFDNAEGGKILKHIQSKFPTFGMERVGSAFFVRTKQDLEAEGRHLKLLSSKDSQQQYFNFLDLFTPTLKWSEIETLSDDELKALVTTTDKKFEAFVSTYNLCCPPIRRINLSKDA